MSVQIEDLNLRRQSTLKLGLRMTEERTEVYEVGRAPSIIDVEIEPKQRKSEHHFRRAKKGEQLAFVSLCSRMHKSVASRGFQKHMVSTLLNSVSG